MTKDELINRLQDIEWEDFEVKEARYALPKNIWETVSAFSNTSGGWIVLGVKQRGKVFEIQGVEDIEKMEQDFSSVVRSQKFNISLSFSMTRHVIEGKDILTIHIPSSVQKPVYFGNPSNSFIRIGSGDQRATENEVLAMYHDQSFGVRSEMPVAGTSLSSLDMDSLHGYRNYLKSYNVLAAYNNLEDIDFCKRLAICSNAGELTYSGLLMFGKGEEVLRYVPTFCMDYVEIPGRSVAEAATRYSYRIPEQENLWEAYQVVIRRLLTLVDRPFRMNKLGVAEDDDRQFEVLREAWVNMLMHADHFSPVRSGIRVFTDRIEFMNAGTFPIPPERMYGMLYSSARNPTIAKLFRFAKLSENVGFGISKLLSWKELTHSDVTIKSERDYVLVTLYLKSDIVDTTQKTTQKTTQETARKTTRKLTVQQQAILDYLSEHPYASRKEITENVENITEDGVKYNLNRLQQTGLIRRVGPDKGGYWEIIEGKEENIE